MKNTSNIIHGLILFIYYFVFVSVSFFVGPYLIERGLGLAIVGYLNALGLIMLIISLIFMGFLADLKIFNKKIISINLIISAFIFFGFINFDSFILLAISYVFMWATFMVSTSLLDGLILKDIKNDRYPQIRAMGSLGAATSYFVNSVALGAASFELIMYINIILLFLIVFLLKFIIEYKFQSHTSFREGLVAVVHNKTVLCIMIISFLTYGVIAADDAYTYTFSVDIAGISAFTMGVVGFISIALESVLMYLYKPQQYRKYQVSLLAFITVLLGLIFMTKGHYYESKSIINLGNILLGVFTGLFIPIAIDIIDQNVDGSVKNSILSFYQIAIKLGGAILGFVTATYVGKTNYLPGIYDLHLFITIIGLLFIYLLAITLPKSKN